MRLSWLRQISRSDDRAALSTRAARNDNKLFCRGNDILISMFKLNIKKYFTITELIEVIFISKEFYNPEDITFFHDLYFPV